MAEPTTESEFKILAKLIKNLREKSDEGLMFVKLYIITIRIVRMTEASFANRRYKKSQLGYIIQIVDDANCANIIHYGSNRFKMVTRSVIVSKLHALLFSFYWVSYIIRDELQDILS